MESRDRLSGTRFRRETAGRGSVPARLSEVLGRSARRALFRGFPIAVPEPCRDTISGDLPACRGHVYRIVTHAMRLLGGDEAAIPNHEFGAVLQRIAGDPGGNRVAGNLRVLRHVFKW